MAHITLSGTIVMDIVEKISKSGTAYRTFRIADRCGEDQIFWDVYVFGELRLSDWMRKGSTAIVRGELMTPRLYTTAKGETRFSLSLKAYNIEFAPKGKKDPNIPEHVAEERNQASMDSLVAFLDEHVPPLGDRK